MKILFHFIMFPAFHLLLKPLIKRNYKLRMKSALNGDGKYPDSWYWADSLALNCGYIVPFSSIVEDFGDVAKLRR